MNMKKIMMMAGALSALLVLLNGCFVRVGNKNYTAREWASPSEDRVTRTRELPPFSHLVVNGSMDVVFVQEEGASRAVVTAPANVIDGIVCQIVGADLQIHFTPDSLPVRPLSPGKVEVTVYGADVQTFSLRGSGDLSVPGGVCGDELAFILNGSGDLTAHGVEAAGAVTVALAGSGDISLSGIDARSVSASLRGSGDVSLAGQTVRAEYNLSGSGDIDARGLKAESTDSRKTGSGDIRHPF